MNLTTIQCRPIAGKPFEYLFFLDLEGHRDEPAVQAALREASSLASETRILGSYPRTPAGLAGSAQ